VHTSNLVKDTTRDYVWQYYHTHRIVQMCDYLPHGP